MKYKRNAYSEYKKPCNLSDYGAFTFAKHMQPY